MDACWACWACCGLQPYDYMLKTNKQGRKKKTTSHANASLNYLSRNKLYGLSDVSSLAEQKGGREAKRESWRKDNNERETMFKVGESKRFYLHNLLACIYNSTHTHTHPCIYPITVVSHHFCLRLFPVFLCLLYINSFFFILFLVFPPALYLCKLSFSHHNSASVPSCCWLFAWNVICRCNRGRNWV